MNRIQAVVLAAGKSTRFAGDKSKLLQDLNGSEVINHVVRAIFQANIESCLVVVGHQGKEIEESLNKEFPSFCKFVYQKNQLGTGDALREASNYFENKDLLVINGDTPMITPNFLKEFILFSQMREFDSSIAACYLDNPFGYGRLIETEKCLKIVEQVELKDSEHKINLINGGVYFFSPNVLKDFELFFLLQSNEDRKEMRITDLFNFLGYSKFKIGYFCSDSKFLMGINTVDQLNEIKFIYKNIF